MDNENYYDKLRANFPSFNSSLRLDERQKKSLESLIGFTEGALSSFRSKVQEADSKFSQYNEKIRGEKRAEALREAKAKSMGSIETEFKKVQDRVVGARTALYNATHLSRPTDSSEALLRFMQQKEIRDGLGNLPIGERIALLQNACGSGDASVLWAIEGRPITSQLLPKDSDVLDRAAKTLVGKMAPEQSALLELSKQDLEGATAIKNLAEVEMRRAEQG